MAARSVRRLREGGGVGGWGRGRDGLDNLDGRCCGVVGGPQSGIDRRAGGKGGGVRDYAAVVGEGEAGRFAGASRCVMLAGYCPPKRC